jgi:hypothetical protein
MIDPRRRHFLTELLKWCQRRLGRESKDTNIWALEGAIKLIRKELDNA